MNIFLPESLPGKWSGTNQLYFEGDVFASASTAQAHIAEQGQFISISYTWQFDTQAQDGRIIFQTKLGEDPTRAVWLDSWHVKRDIMVCQATQNQAGTVLIKGSYPFPPGPDWNWRIEISTTTAGLLLIRMFNISPNGLEALAVSAQYWRIAAWA